MHVHGLRNRVVVAFLLSALFIAVLFGFFNLMFIYSVEDTAFIHLLDDEAAHQREHWQQHERLTTPLRDYVAIYTSPEQFPSDVRQPFRDEPKRREFFGDEGRHYHLKILQPASGQPAVYLLAEVSDYLLVRPIRNRMLAFYALSALIVLLFAGLIGYALARHATAPLTRLVELLGDIRPEQAAASFARSFPNNEIGMLAQALEAALQRIAAFVEREQHFTRDASHELRTPITVIRSAAELMARQVLPVATQPQLQQIQSACLQMEQTIDALMSLAREQAPGAVTPIALLPVLEKAIVQHAHLLNEKNVQLDVQVPDSAKVPLPAPVLSILLNNLIANAFHYTKEGRIQIVFRDNALIICDSGPGIDEQLVARLYEPLVKGKDSTGFGLGLSIVKRLCHRFAVGLEIDTQPGHGTRAEVRFPGADT